MTADLANTLFSVAGILVQLAIFVIVRNYLIRAEELLRVVKGWADLARVSHRDTIDVLDAVKVKNNQYDSSNKIPIEKLDEVKRDVSEIKEAVREVPQKVVEAQDKRDSMH